MIDIIVPVYNEADNILPLFQEIEKSIQTDKRVLVIYDFEEDNTIPVVNAHRDDYHFPIEPLLNTYGRGVVNAIKFGFHTASEDMILVIMADLSDRLDVVDAMAGMMVDGYDVVCGSRYMKGGKHHGGPFLKTLFSRTAGLSLHYLTGIPTHDVTNNFKLYSKKVLDSIVIESTGGFEIALEITVKAYIKGYRIGEIPSEWFDRVSGESQFHMWRWMPMYLKWYWYCVKHHFLKI